jgi:phospholipid/cholesterol/gamma-HCH transport system permease protein
MPEVSVRVADDTSGSALTLKIDGSLDIHTLSSAWPAALHPIRKRKPNDLVIDCGGLKYCDGAGLGLFTQIRREMAAWSGQLRLENLRPELQSLMNMATLADPSAPQLNPQPKIGFVSHAGSWGHSLLSELHGIVAFLGETCAAFAFVAVHPRHFRLREMLAVCDRTGTNALPVICLLGFLIGVILAFQAATPLGRYGLQDMIPTIVSISIIRELGPLLATLLLAGRTGSAFAAELGTMTVTQEISALKSMGIDPMRFLVIPRVLAAILMSPLLAVFSNLLGIIGGYAVMMNFGFSVAAYISQVKQAVTYKDLLSGEMKTLAFGLIVGGVGCMRGLRTGNGPGAVGDSATRAVVTSIVLIIVADGIFGVVFYYLKV